MRFTLANKHCELLVGVPFSALACAPHVSAVCNQRHGRQGVTGERAPDEIGYHAIRAGDDPGQHTILFGMMGEKIELRVAASNRDCYALGAIAAAKFLSDKSAGMYNMYDVLGFN